MLFSKCFKKISPEQVKLMMESDKEVMLLDVREKGEFRQGHISDSKNIPVGQLGSMKNKLPQDKQTPIITYCLSGMRAKNACSALSGLGYNQLYCLGGINSWPYDIKR